MRSRNDAATLRGGRTALLRPLQPDDRERLVQGFERLSPESRYRRFFRSMDHLSARDLDYLINVDHRDHEAILAIDPEQDEAIGVARYVRSSEDRRRAEAAVVVADDWQGRGLGRELLERLSERATAEGIERFTALVQADNLRAARLLASIGPTERSSSNALIELDIELQPEGLSSSLALALRAAAGSAFGTRPLAERILQKARELYLGSGAGAARPRYALAGPIVVGTDGSDSASRAVSRAAELAEALGAPLHVVAAYRNWTERLLRTARLDLAAAGQAELDPRRAATEAAEHARDDAQLRAATNGTDRRLEITVHAREGDAAGVLLDLAEELSAQLIVVGSRGMRDQSRFALGSVPDKLSHAGTCNVLIENTVEE